MPRLSIRHRTELRYSGPATESVNEVRLVPRDTGRTIVHHADVTVTPAGRTSSHMDAFGNVVRWFQVIEPHDRLVVEAEAIVTASAPGRLVHSLTPSEQWAALGHPAFIDGLAEYLAPSHYAHACPEVAALAKEMAVPEGGGVETWLLDLAQAVSDAVVYEPGATAVDTPVEVVARLRRGVCQDLAHLAIALCRTRGVPARYVSGWLYGPMLQGPAESHAWIEAHVPGAGWFEIDPTHPGRLDGHHVRVAVGRDYADVTPLRGSYRGAPPSGMSVTVEIEELPAAA